MGGSDSEAGLLGSCTGFSAATVRTSALHPFAQVKGGKRASKNTDSPQLLFNEQL